DEVYAPIPYAFNYLSALEDGSHSHEESGDGNGRVTGKYTLSTADGRTRTVTYVADENGFRAEVVTNEQGTESKNPADVTIQSSALPGPEAAIANEPNRIHLPQPSQDVQGELELGRVDSALHRTSHSMASEFGHPPRITTFRQHRLDIIIFVVHYRRYGPITSNLSQFALQTKYAMGLSSLLAVSWFQAAQRGFGGARPDEVFAPIPYAFNYLSQLEDGSHSHEESGDGSGRVTGKYTLSTADGRTRTVTYVADENGFRAEVVTNEQGTESKNPADVTIQSSALPGPEAAIANEGNRRG
ncbi:unnamed protein product, partial [Ixodes hexagonus]